MRGLLVWHLLRGLTVGIAGTCGLFIARKSGLPQNNLVAARGVGLTLGPAFLGFAVGRIVWSGNSQVGVASALALKMVCELLVPRTDGALALYLAFFGIGFATAMLDIFTTVLMSRVHGRRMGTMLVFYDTFYGIGCMIAPFIAVMDPQECWNLLAAFDFVLAAAIAGKRLIAGKPRDWKVKLRRGCDSPDPSQGKALMAPKPPPPRVVRAGMAYTFMVQFTMTAVSCWGFTYASTTLGMPASLAATIPGSFYAACTIARLFIAPATLRHRPSVIMHVSILLTVVAAVAFYVLDFHLTAALAAGASADTVVSLMPLLVACFMAMGAGFCPHFSLMLAAMQEHGELAPQQHGWYGTSTCLGVTAGMWLPGLVRLPIIELAGSACLLLMLNGFARDFPRSSKGERRIVAVKFADP
mmetsp:Transcript_89868/g.277893  ORF Transcript_89868/g.277893 Transcript_89868/m.277893 type:complete len:413 (+) Transcript_89868:3-1241(+)